MKRIYPVLSTLAIAILFAGIGSVFAQPALPTNASRFWFSSGLGVCTLGNMAGSVNAGVQFNKTYISLRATANSAGMFYDEFYDIGLLVGFADSSEKGLVSLAVGIAQVTGSRSEGLALFGSGGRKNITPTLGLPIEMQFFRNISRVFGIGLYGYLNLNGEQPFGGVTLNLRIGRLR